MRKNDDLWTLRHPACRRGVEVSGGILCLDCYERYSQVKANLMQADEAKSAGLNAMQNYYSELIDYQLGFRTNSSKILEM